MDGGADFWTDETSVFFTSFWGWSPETWGGISWSNKARRDNLLKELTDPFIAVCYVTSNASSQHDLRGKIAGFYLVSHETCDRDEFSHPVEHDHEPTMWRHGLKALRAFSYLPEYTMLASELIPNLKDYAKPIGTWGKVLEDKIQIQRLKEIPWEETNLYAPGGDLDDLDAGEEDRLCKGKVRGGPASRRGYMVSSGTYHLPRELYVLKLTGDTCAYLGDPSETREIFKIGLSKSPELRRRAFQAALPQGAFEWRVERTSSKSGAGGPFAFDAAKVGEDAMKTHLADHAKWLGGEFYLASCADIDEAWRIGHIAAKRTTTSFK